MVLLHTISLLCTFSSEKCVKVSYAPSTVVVSLRVVGLLALEYRGIAFLSVTIGTSNGEYRYRARLQRGLATEQLNLRAGLLTQPLWVDA